MNWPRILSCAMYGVLWGLWTMASAIGVLGGMPDSFGWLKLGAVGVISTIGGIFTFTRDPEAAWKAGPGK